MAGIGFELKKLFQDKSAFGYARAYFYTAIVTVGPLLLALLLLLALQLALKEAGASYAVRMVYQGTVVYALVFSQIVSSGFAMVITRFVADQLFEQTHEKILPALYGTLLLALFFGAWPAIFFLWDSPLDVGVKGFGYILYMALIVVWIQAVYLSALKDYKKITIAYGVGLLVALALAAIVIGCNYDLLLGMMGAVCGGIFTIVGLLQWELHRFFPWVKGVSYFDFLHTLLEYKELFFINFFYTVGLYSANFFFWQGEGVQVIADTYYQNPDYDMATFFAFLTIIPTMMLFVISTELSFYDKYQVYFRRITGKGNYQEISEARQDMQQVLWSEIRHLMEFQLGLSLLFLAAGNYFLPMFGGSYRIIEMYTILVLAAYCVAVMQSILILLLYFEDRKGALGVSGVFCGIGFLLNGCSLLDGNGNTYGFGLFIAAFTALCMSLKRLDFFTQRIDYYVFCTQPVFRQVSQGGFLWRCLRRWLLVVVAVVGLGAPTVVQAGAPQVISDSQNQLAGLKNAAAVLQEHRRLVAELENITQELKKADELVRQARQEKQEADARVIAARLTQNQSDAHRAEAEWLLRQSQQELVKAEQHLMRIQQELVQTQARNEMFQQRLIGARAAARESENRELQKLRIDELTEEKLNDMIQAAETINQKLDGAAEEVSRLEEEADGLEAEFDRKQELLDIAKDSVQEKKDVMKDAQELQKDAVEAQQEALQEVIDAQKDAQNTVTFVKEASNYVQELGSYKLGLEKQLQGPAAAREGTLEQRYYSWSGNGSSGYQWLKTGTVAYSDKNVDASLRLQHINAQASVNGTSGYLTGWMDTQLAMTRTQENKAQIWKYGLDVNLPTGMTRLSAAARQAQIDDDLVETDVFGEGWNWTPRVEWSYKKGEQDLWTLGTSYGFRGSYVRYASGSAADTVNYSPGNEWSRYLRWRHLGDKNRIEWEASNSVYSAAALNGAAWYRSGNAWDVRGSYAKTLTPTTELQLYVRQHWDAAEHSYQGEDLGGGQKRRYAGVALEKEVHPGRLLRFSLDGMWADGNLLDPQTNLLKSKRQRYSFGVGYDITLPKERRIYLDLRWFRLHQDEAASYHGYQLSCGFFQSL